MQQKLPRGETMEEYTIIKKGYIVDLSELLLTEERNYLIKYDNQQLGDDVPSVFVKSVIYKWTPAETFEKIFSKMACTAIPFPDLESRNRLERIFGVSSGVDLLPRSFVIDPKGLVLQSNATHLFSRYGAEGYPFTDERIQCIDSEDNIARMQLSVKTLLGSLLASPERDYVITNKGDKVPVHNLEDKVVGIYFYANGWRDKEFTEDGL